MIRSKKVSKRYLTGEPIEKWPDIELDSAARVGTCQKWTLDVHLMKLELSDGVLMRSKKFLKKYSTKEPIEEWPDIELDFTCQAPAHPRPPCFPYLLRGGHSGKSIGIVCILVSNWSVGYVVYDRDRK